MGSKHCTIALPSRRNGDKGVRGYRMDRYGLQVDESTSTWSERRDREERDSNCR